MNSSGLLGSRPKGRRIGQGYKTQGLEGKDSSRLYDSGSRRNEELKATRLKA